MVLASLLVSGCFAEDIPLGPRLGGGGYEVLAAVECRVGVREGVVVCETEEGGAPTRASGALIGGQGRYLILEATNTTYADDTLSADVTVRNVTTQSLGMLNASNAHRDGVRVFFHGAPAVKKGNGAVTVANADGTGTFTNANQAYFQYDAMLAPGQTSRPKRWKFHAPASVEEFTFSVYVAAQVLDEGEIGRGLAFAVNSVGVGELHSCAVALDGTLYCWGSNSNGQVGDGTFTAALNPTPVAVPPGVKIASVAVGYRFTCALSLDGVAYCWGYSLDGELGRGVGQTTMATPLPVFMPEGKKFVSLDAGEFHVCAVTAEGDGYCWGLGIDGMLGTGTSYSRHEPYPVTMPEGVKFVKVSVGRHNSCALSTEGKAYCWGRNQYGALGDGGATVGNGLTPVAVVMPAGKRFRDISVGQDHVCAVDTDGGAWCWGSAELGRLGNGATEGYTNVPVEVDRPESVKYEAISAGFETTCAVRSDGKVACWGVGGWYDKLGPGVSESPTPVEISVPDNPKFVSVSALEDHICATAVSGEVYCWGYNGAGQPLGRVTPGSWYSGVPAPVDFSKQPTSVSVGYYFGCMTTADGKVYCWGYNDRGQLGTTAGGTRAIPQELQSPPAGETFVSVSAGRTHACALAASGEIYCWGFDFSGRFGAGGGYESTTPVRVQRPVGKTFSQVDVGRDITCALTTDGLAYCWGEGRYGGLGNGTNTSPQTTPVPVQMPEGKTFVKIEAGHSNVSDGYSSVCALTGDGELYCWGFSDMYGTIGNGVRQFDYHPNTPTRVSSLSGKQVVDFSVGSMMACAVTTEGKVYCWGDNRNGALGNPSFLGGESPNAIEVQTPAGKTFTRVSAAIGACALTTDGDAYCWGESYLGNNTSSNSSIPVAVSMPAGVKFVAISRGAALNSCALGDDDTVYCWGAGDLGTIGNGYYDTALRPTPVAKVTVRFIAAAPFRGEVEATPPLPARTTFTDYLLARRGIERVVIGEA